jgi:hypothetical protein
VDDDTVITSEKTVPNQHATPEPVYGTDLSGLSEHLHPLLALWQSRAQDTGLPSRAAFSPRDLKPWLPAIHVYEVADDQHFIVRLLGTAIVGAIGQDQTGRSFGAEHTDLLATRAFKFLSLVIREGKPVRSSAPRIASVKQSWHSAESLWLPLGFGTTVHHILAATVLTQLG